MKGRPHWPTKRHVAHREIFYRLQTCRPRHAALIRCVAKKMVLLFCFLVLPGDAFHLLPRLPGALSGTPHTPCPQPPSHRLHTALLGALLGAAMDRPPPSPPASPASCAISACPLPVRAGEGNGQGQQERKNSAIAQKLSVGEPYQGRKHKHSRSTQSVLEHGMQTTSLSKKAAGIRKKKGKNVVTKKSRASRKSANLVRGAGVGVGDGARHGDGRHLVGSGARVCGPCWR